ncbi:lipoprotein [Spiroplasma endosymbiont of Atherix ibis]|uniref:lipoprotein n=1 Tax=Spiroplasma endosymbiont of Atherix ibis TaxID=3066291 RepID=UPI0030D4AF8E
MKKLLSVLATVGVIASSTVSVVACGTKSEKKPEEYKKDITQVVRNFERDVAKIWSEHYEKEVASNLITLEDVKNDYKFLNKKNIQKFSKS